MLESLIIFPSSISIILLQALEIDSSWVTIIIVIPWLLSCLIRFIISLLVLLSKTPVGSSANIILGYSLKLLQLLLFDTAHLITLYTKNKYKISNWWILEVYNYIFLILNLIKNPDTYKINLWSSGFFSFALKLSNPIITFRINIFIYNMA